MASKSTTLKKAARAAWRYSSSNAAVARLSYAIACLTALTCLLKRKAQPGEDESRLPRASRRGDGQTEDYPNWTFEHVNATDEWNVRTRSRSFALNAGENYLMDPTVQVFRMGVGRDRGLDVGAFVILLDEQRMVVDTVSSLQRTSRCESVEHSVDNCAVASDDVNEFFYIDLSRLPLSIHHLLVFVDHHGSDPANKNDASVRIGITNEEAEDFFTGRVMFNCTLTKKPGQSTTAGILTRRGPMWNFKALEIHSVRQSPEQLMQNDEILRVVRESRSWKPELRHIKIRVLRARDLAARNPAGDHSQAAPSGPFYVSQFKNETFTSAHASQCLNPSWESPSFDMGWITEAEMKPLKVKIFNQNSSSDFDFMGMIMIPGNAFFRLGPGHHIFWFLLGDCEQKTDTDTSGHILVDITVTTAE